MRRPVGFFLLTIVAATLAALIVYSTLRQKQAEIERARAGMTSIVVAAHDIGLGAKLDATAVKLARWPRDMLPPGAILDTGSVIGMFSKAEFVEDEPIVSSRLVSPEATSGVLPLMIPKEMRAMSVAVDEVADMAGFILPYTRVDVLLALPGSAERPGRSKIILENVPVLAVAQTLERKDQPQPERIVTLLVTPAEAERLAVAQSLGKLHLALRNYADNALIATTGSDVEKVMSAFSPEAPPPQPTQQPVAVHFRLPRTRIRRPDRIEVMRDGHPSEVVTIGASGRASLSAQVGAAGPQADQPPAAAGGDLSSEENALVGNEENGDASGIGSAGTMIGAGISGGVAP